MNAFSGAYQNIVKNQRSFNSDADKPKLTYNFVEGAFLEISGGSNEYFVEFFDKRSQELIYKTILKPNTWARASRRYFADWQIRIYKQGSLVTEINLNLFNRRVYIALDSRSLGDTLAWFPYVEEFRRKHNCYLICSTFHNYLFQKSYPNIEFVEPGVVVDNILAMYKIGCFDFDKRDYSPISHNLIPLQKVASDILGLSFKEVRPKIDGTDNSKINEKLICISTQSTAGCKMWNNPSGWADLCKWLNNKGLEVINLNWDGPEIDGVKRLPKMSLKEIIPIISSCKFFVGLTSGLSWFAWGLNKSVVLISGLTEPWYEFQDCVRIFSPIQSCRGCWNWNNNIFDKGDWNWCPKYKETSQQFECSKSISADLVIQKILENKLIV